MSLFTTKTLNRTPRPPHSFSNTVVSHLTPNITISKPKPKQKGKSKKIKIKKEIKNIKFINETSHYLQQQNKML